MVNQQMLDYIKQQLEKNISKEQIKSSLLSNGWDASDVEEGFTAIGPRFSGIPSTPPASVTPDIKSVSNIINPVVNSSSQSVNITETEKIFKEDKKSFLKKYTGGILGAVVYIITIILIIFFYGYSPSANLHILVGLIFFSSLSQNFSKSFEKYALLPKKELTKSLNRIFITIIIILILDFLIKLFYPDNIIFGTIAILVLFPMEIIFLVNGFFRSIFSFSKIKNLEFIYYIVLFGLVLVGRVIYSLYSINVLLSF